MKFNQVFKLLDAFTTNTRFCGSIPSVKFCKDGSGALTIRRYSHDTISACELAMLTSFCNDYQLEYFVKPHVEDGLKFLEISIPIKVDV